MQVEVRMPSPEYQFTEISRLEPESIGEPGKRTFRLLIESSASSAILWLEKEQLFQLAIAAQQVCDEIPSSGNSAAPPTELEAPELTNLEFQIYKLAMDPKNIILGGFYGPHMVRMCELYHCKKSAN